jgi:hypothetical protein
LDAVHDRVAIVPKSSPTASHLMDSTSKNSESKAHHS